MNEAVQQFAVVFTPSVLDDLPEGVLVSVGVSVGPLVDQILRRASPQLTESEMLREASPVCGDEVSLGELQRSDQHRSEAARSLAQRALQIQTQRRAQQLVDSGVSFFPSGRYVAGDWRWLGHDLTIFSIGERFANGTRSSTWYSLVGVSHSFDSTTRRMRGFR